MGFFDRPQLPGAQPNPEPPGNDIARQLLLQRMTQQSQNPFGLSPEGAAGLNGPLVNPGLQDAPGLAFGQTSRHDVGDPWFRQSFLGGDRFPTGQSVQDRMGPPSGSRVAMNSMSPMQPSQNAGSLLQMLMALLSRQQGPQQSQSFYNGRRVARRRFYNGKVFYDAIDPNRDDEDLEGGPPKTNSPGLGISGGPLGMSDPNPSLRNKPAAAPNRRDLGPKVDENPDKGTQSIPDRPIGGGNNLGSGGSEYPWGGHNQGFNNTPVKYGAGGRPSARGRHMEMPDFQSLFGQYGITGSYGSNGVANMSSPGNQMSLDKPTWNNYFLRRGSLPQGLQPAIDQFRSRGIQAHQRGLDPNTATYQMIVDATRPLNQRAHESMDREAANPHSAQNAGWFADRNRQSAPPSSGPGQPGIGPRTGPPQTNGGNNPNQPY